MRIYLLTMMFILGLGIIGRLVMLASGTFSVRTPTTVALDLATSIVLLVWTVVLLTKI